MEQVGLPDGHAASFEMNVHDMYMEVVIRGEIVHKKAELFGLQRIACEQGLRAVFQDIAEQREMCVG